MTAEAAARDPLTDAVLLRRGASILRRIIRGDPRNLIGIGFVGATAYAAMVVVSAHVLGWVTDTVVLPAVDAGRVEPRDLAAAAGVILGVALVKAVGIVGRRLGAYMAYFRLQALYRQAVTRRYLDLPIAWHRRHTTGALLSNANADVEAATFLATPLPMALASALLLLATGGLLLISDLYLAAVGFVVVPALAFINWRFQGRMRTRVEAAQQSRAEVSGIAHESFDNALVVKTLGREGAETARFQERSELLQDQMIEVGRLRATFDPIIEALPNIGILLVLLVGAWRVSQGELSAGDLVKFAYLFRLTALPMRVFGWLLGELPRSVVGMHRVDRVLEATGQQRYGGVELAGEGGVAVRADAVRFHHPPPSHDSLATDLVVPDITTPPDEDVERRGLEDVNLDIQPGRTIAIVGPTGSGKSTLAALLVRLLDPDAGRLAVDGADLGDLSRASIADTVGVVFQEAFLFDDTVRENITLGADLPHGEVVRAAELAQAHGFVSALPEGYDTRVGERGATLSGGQRQRIAIARALVRQPRLLVLDDATSATDPAVEAAILDGLAASEVPATVIVIAYRRRSIELADEVVFIQDGRISGRGSHEHLLAHLPAYRDLVTAYDRAEEARG